MNQHNLVYKKGRRKRSQKGINKERKKDKRENELTQSCVQERKKEKKTEGNK